MFRKNKRKVVASSSENVDAEGGNSEAVLQQDPAAHSGESSEDKLFSVAPSGSARTTRSSRVRAPTVRPTYKEEPVPSTKKTKASKSSNAPKFYTSNPEELEENAQLMIFGENWGDEDALPESSHAAASSVPGEFLPVRTLDNYIIFDEAKKQKLVSWEALGDDYTDVHAVGVVRPVYIEANDEQLDEEDEDVQTTDEQPRQQLVRLSAIFNWDIDTVDENGITPVYLRTTFGWYKLLRPAPEMLPIIGNALKQINLLGMVVHHIHRNPNQSWKDLLEVLKASSFAFTEKEVKVNAASIHEEIQRFMDAHLEQGGDLSEILDSPIVQKIAALSQGKAARSMGQRAEATGRVRAARNMNDEVLKHTVPTTVTPWIKRVAGGLFVRTLIVATSNNVEAGVRDAEEAEGDARDLVDLTSDPRTAISKSLQPDKLTTEVTWVGKSTWKDKESGRRGYTEVLVNKHHLKVGDCVALRPGIEEIHSTKQSSRKTKKEPLQPSPSPDPDTDGFWFARIVYLYEDADGEKNAHFRWFLHAAHTLLEQTAAPRELVLLDQCDDNPLSAVCAKIDVKKLGFGDLEPVGEHDRNKFFYRYWYSTENGIFEEISKHEKQSFDVSEFECECCASLESGVRFFTDNSSDGFAFKGVEYRVNDFVYCLPGEAGVPYKIGQITKVVELASESLGKADRKGADSPQTGVVVRLFKRHDKLLSGDFTSQLADTGDDTVHDSRRLYLAPTTIAVGVNELAGQCWVAHRNEIKDFNAYKDKQDTFWFNDEMLDKKGTKDNLFPASPLGVCKKTLKARDDLESLYETFTKEGRKLRGLDIFAGAGGLTIGLDLSGIVETKWAIEFAPSAAKSLKQNMPSIVVYTQDANTLLSRAIQENDGEEVRELDDFQGEPLPKMPAKGDVDFIYGGPPCQGFSRINRFQKENDIKNSLITTFLSYVDHYKPNYFLLENVKGLLTHSLGEGKVIKSGTVKFIFRALTSMGYQVRFGVLQAGQYGVPQTRRRVIFWGAKIGVELPQFPLPSHCFDKANQTAIRLPPDGATFDVSTRHGNNNAPHRSILVGDVVTDLPGFEYVNPHVIYEVTPEEKATENARKYPKYHMVECRTGPEGMVGEQVQRYLHPPLTEYQRSLRRGVASDKLTCHFSRTFNDVNTERICKISFEKGSDHHSLPEKLKPWCLAHPDSRAAAHGGWKGLYGRLDPDGIFGTALTEIQPCGKSGTVLHPTQHRVISVREHARSQGFPDSYVFETTSGKVTEMHRAAGNAVPVPLAEALGRALRDAVLNDFKRAKDAAKE